MATVQIPEDLRRLISRVDGNRCAYCRTSEANTGIPLTIDHIQPVAKGGSTAFDNLCLACRPCNEFKYAFTEAQDPLTGEIVPLFDPARNNGQTILNGAPMAYL